MAESFNSLYMRDPEAAARQRRAAQAQALMKAGSDTSALQGTGNNSMQAIARALQGITGGVMAGLAGREAQAAGDEMKAEAKAVNAEFAAMNGFGPPAAPAMTENLGGAPNANGPAPVPQVQQGPLGADTFALQRQQESGGNPNARNPLSSATGADQFIRGTWLDYARANPDRFQGMSEEQILARRTDPEESGRATQWYAGQNGQALTGAGLPAGPGELTLAHRFGPAGAQAALRADPDAPAAQVFGEQVMRANPDLAGKTVGQVVGQYQSRYGGGVAGRTGGTDMAGPGVPQQAMASALANPQQAPAPQGPDRRQMIAFILKHGDNPNPAVQRQVQMVQSLLPTLGREAAPGPTVEINGPQGPGVYERGPGGQMRFLGPKPPSEGAAPMSPERFRQQRELAEAGRPSMSVNTGNSFGSTLGQQTAKALDEGRTAATGAVQTIQSAQRVRELLNSGAITGSFAEGRLGFERALTAAGLVDGKRVTNTEQLMSELAGGVLSRSQQMAGVLTDRDIEFLKQAAAGSITLNADTIRRVAEISERGAGSLIQRYNDTVGSLQNTPDLPDVARQIYQPIRPPAAAAPPPPPAGGGAQPAGAPVQVQSPEEAMRLPSGTPILLPDGTVGRVP